MDDIADLFDQVADRLGPHSFDVEAMIADTRMARRRRRRLQVAGSTFAAVAVLALAVGVADTLSSGPPASSGGTALATTAGRHTERPTVVPVVTFRTGPPPLPGVPPRPTRTLPQGFAPACGKPGTKLMVRIVPVTIPYRICDLSGVEIDRPGKISAVVPPRGQVVSVVVDGVAGAKPPPQGLSITTDKRTGDVTIAAP